PLHEAAPTRRWGPLRVSAGQQLVENPYAIVCPTDRRRRRKDPSWILLTAHGGGLDRPSTRSGPGSPPPAVAWSSGESFSFSRRRCPRPDHSDSATVACAWPP